MQERNRQAHELEAIIQLRDASSLFEGAQPLYYQPTNKCENLKTLFKNSWHGTTDDCPGFGWSQLFIYGIIWTDDVDYSLESFCYCRKGRDRFL